MKRVFRILCALTMAALMTLSLLGCALREETPAAGTAVPEGTAAPSDAAYTDAERAQVAAQVGEHVITKGDVIDEYESMLSYYSYYGIGAPSADADIETMQDTVIEGLVSEKILLYYAGEAGLLPLPADAAAEAQAQYDTEIESLMTNFRAYAEEEGAADVEARTVEMINETLAENGWAVDYEGYKLWLLEQMQNDKAIALLETRVKSVIKATDEDVSAYYDDLLASQQERYALTPAEYLTDMEMYEMEGGEPALITPEGYVRVKVIDIAPEGELDAAYSEKRDAIGALESEYGALALADAAGNAARLAEIVKEYTDLSRDAKTLYDAYTMNARAKANEALAQLKGGASFDETLKTYAADDTYTNYSAIAEKGRLMLPGSEDGWDKALHEAAGALADGAYSDVIEIDGVFYILQRVGAEPAGTRSFEAVRDELVPLAAEAAQETAWQEQQEAWLGDKSIVTYHTEVFRDIGK